MAGFSLQPRANFDTQLRKGVVDGATKEWFARIAFNASKIIQKLGDLLVYSFESTEVAKALRGGGGGDDLPAHLGMSDTTANQMVDAMSDIIRKSVTLITQPSNTGGIVKINAVSTDYAEFFSVPGASYVSSPSNITIPVMQWLLIDPTIDIGQAAYEIVFLGEGGSGIDARIEKVSRSGRAIMVDLEKLGGGGGYVLPAIVRGGAGANFIEFAIRQPNIAQQAAKIVMANV